MTTRTVAVDGLNVETTEAGAVALQKLISERDDARAKLAAADAKAVTDAQAHAAAIAAKDAQLAEAKKAIPDAAVLEQMARDHAVLCEKAKALKPDIVTTGKDAETIRKEVVLAKLGDAAKDYTPDQVRVAFDVVAVDAKPATGSDPIVPDGTVQLQTTDNQPAQNTRLQKLQDAWKKRPAA